MYPLWRGTVGLVGTGGFGETVVLGGPPSLGGTGGLGDTAGLEGTVRFGGCGGSLDLFLGGILGRTDSFPGGTTF